MTYTQRERELLNGWPAVTEEDLTRMNDLFPHYLFFRRVKTLGLTTIDLRYFEGDLSAAIQAAEPDLVLTLYAASTTALEPLFDSDKTEE